ncbi:MAG: DUF3369 domain-containing protein [Sneathiella sp.]|nr:DUF3369 domain-containing protein [Sneathiella sp.]
MNLSETEASRDNDIISFADEVSDRRKSYDGRYVWKVLIVDDEEAVHQVTELALDGFEFEGHPLLFYHAYTGDEALECLQRHDDIAVVLLDVVMESDHAGLEAVKYIREVLKNQQTRIILRTGQPGQAPEQDVIQQYDINDYKEKTELTAQKFTTLMYASLRSYRDIMALEKNKLGLEHIIDSTADIFALQNIDGFTEGVLQQLTSLMRLGSSAIYMQLNGVAVHASGDALPIVVGTGDFKELEGKDAREGLSEQALQDINLAIKTKNNHYIEDRFAGFFSTTFGFDSVLYITGVRPLNEIDRNLIEVFLRNIGIAYENVDLHKEIEETQREIVYLLGEAVETRSKETGNHVKRVAEISKLLALELGLSDEEAEILRLASPLHDVGKIGIPDAILNKEGPLEGQEWEVMKTHASLGRDMLKNSRKRILQAGAIIAGEHHEKWDGSGYPIGKQGKEIHIYGRITAIADVFDALGNDRCYKAAWPLEEIMSYIQDQSGKQFDPEIVRVFTENLETIQKICNAYYDK